MSNWMQIIVQGNLGQDPVRGQLPSGAESSIFPVAVNLEWTDANGNAQSQTHWFRVYVSNHQAAACNRYLSKGRSVTVVGTIRSNEWGNPRIWYAKNDEEKANPRCSHEINARLVNFHGTATNGGGNGHVEEEDDPIPGFDSPNDPF